MTGLAEKLKERGLWLRVATFIGVFLAATWLHFMLRTEVATHVTRDVNATTAAWLINTFTPDAHVAVSGEARLGNAAASVSIATACDGIDALLMLVAAVAIFPMPWRKRLMGVAMGATLLFLVNVVRIMSLWYCLRYWPSFFETMHLTVGQTMVIVAAVGFFAVWSGLFQAAPQPTQTLRSGR